MRPLIYKPTISNRRVSHPINNIRKLLWLDLRCCCWRR